jgi:hypothetical protein
MATTAAGFPPRLQDNLTPGCNPALDSPVSLAKSRLMQIYRLVYYSKCNLTSSGNPVAADLKQILASAIRNNSERGISGGLVFNRKFFGQILEGEHAAVMQTFVRIRKDPRHNDVVIAEMEPAGERLFGAWSMGYAGNTELFKKLCVEYGADLTAFILALVTDEEKFSSSEKIAAA